MITTCGQVTAGGQKHLGCGRRTAPAGPPGSRSRKAPHTLILISTILRTAAGCPRRPAPVLPCGTLGADRLAAQRAGHQQVAHDIAFRLFRRFDDSGDHSNMCNLELMLRNIGVAERKAHNARVRPRPGLDVAGAVLAGGPVCRQRTRRQLTEQLAPRARVRVARREYNSVGSRCRRYVEIQPAPPSRCERSWCDCGHILRQSGWWRRITAAPVLALKSGIS